jgi:hypothetical protein
MAPIATTSTKISRSSVSKTGDLGGYQLLQDAMPLRIIRKQRVMSEDIHGQKIPVLRIGGQFQVADEPNANGRIYPFPVLKQAVSEIQEDIKERGVLCEWDHPPDAKIHLDRLCAVLTKLWMEGKKVFGECEILDNLPFGAHLKGLQERNIRVGISSRGVGDMETVIHEGQEYYKVMPGYTFITFDIVAEPSVHGSYMSIKESRDRSKQGVQVTKTMKEAAVIAEMQRLLREGK